MCCSTSSFTIWSESRDVITPHLAIPLLHAVHHHWGMAFLICLTIMLTGVIFQVFSLLTYRRIKQNAS